MANKIIFGALGSYCIEFIRQCIAGILDLFGLWFYVTGNSILSCRDEFSICANVEIICALLHTLAVCQSEVK